MNTFRPDMQKIVDHTTLFATILTLDGPQVVNCFDHISFYPKLDGWVRNLAFERRLRHRREQVESVFVGWHNVEIFAVPIARRLLQ